jgi:hypothetical protein
MINKIPKNKIYYYKSLIENYHLNKEKDSTLKSLKQIREEMHSLYDRIYSSIYCVAKSVSLIDNPPNIETKIKEVKDHTLRPSSTLFLPLYFENYYKKYLSNFNLLNNLLQCSKIVCKVTKEEHNRITNLKCLTKDIYKVAKVKVFNLNEDCIEQEYYTPGFEYLLPEVQKDLTEIEKSLNYREEVK